MLTYIINARAIPAGMPHLDIFRRQKGKCLYCENDLFGDNYNHDCTRDHLFPKSAGFKTNGNIVLSCYDCNLKKGNRLPTVHEVVKAYNTIYRKSGHGFICHTRNGRVVLRVT